MKAIRIHKTGGPDVLKLDEISIPEPGDKEVLVNVAAAGVNYIDTYHRTGLYPLSLPAVIGREGSGVIEKVGKNVKDWKVGEKVAFLSGGAYAEKVLISNHHLTRIPKDVSLREAAAVLLQGLTAHYLACSTYPLKEKDFALVHAGAGGTGALLIQIAKIRGAIVITTVSNAEKAKVAKAAGADYIINYTTEDFEEKVKKITEGKGVQVVYDGVGASTWEKSMKSLAKRGYLVLFGNASGPVPAITPLSLTQHGSIFVTRPTLFDYIVTPDEFQARCKDLFQWISQKKLITRIAKEFDLQDAGEAHKHLEGRNALGKVLLIVNSKL